ncbi:MAG: hypothetical protein IKO78_01640 [Bacilli bacterium]|nr:hypothetical protein [Bacilli bacterium]
MRYVHTNKDPEEIDYVIPDNDGDTYAKDSSVSDDEILPYDENDMDTANTVNGLIKFGVSGAGVIVGGIMLGVGLSGSVEGTKKIVALVAGAGIASFSVVKCIKSAMTIVGIDQEKNKKLTKAKAKE